MHSAETTLATFLANRAKVWLEMSRLAVTYLQFPV